MNTSLTSHVNGIAKDLEDDATLRDKDILEVKYEVSNRGTVTEVIAVLTVGGPHIEVECLNGVVSGAWSGETFRRGIESEDVTQYGRMRANEMESRID